MKILILGAGQVGSSVATNLCGESNDITVVDTNPAALNHLQDPGPHACIPLLD